jgi:hypothetical protein
MSNVMILAAALSLTSVVASPAFAKSAETMHANADVTASFSEDSKTLILTGAGVIGGRLTLDASSFQATALNWLDTDVEPYTSRPQLLSGVFLTELDVNPRTGKVAVGVYADYKLLSSWSFVFIVDARTGSKNLVRMPTKGEYPAPGSTNAFDSVQRVRYDSSGRLSIDDGNASGQVVRYVFNPDLTLHACKIIEVGEGFARCDVD